MYKGLSRAQLSFDYLHTNSTTHEFLFGALAELLDNARDAYATKINIHSVSDTSLRGGYMLCFLDDGQGMSPEEASDIITFGKSTKKSLDSHMIGKYGNGLKSGSMRIGNDLMLFTKKDSALTCVFLSRTFHEREQLEEIIVPMPSFDTNTKRPLARTSREREKHVQEMELILKYSPFKTDAQFMKEFDKIESRSGTLVIVYNLKLLDNGEPELDVTTDLCDVLLSLHEDDGNDELMPERKSFRSYASILYVEPRMRVYIQGKKVRTKRIVSSLYRPRSYRYTSARFKARSEKETKKAEEDARNAEHRAREAESKAKELEIKLGTMPDKEQRIELRKAQTHALELRKEAQLRKAISERKKKTLKEPKQLTFVFGINLENRSRDGVFVYNCSRLIKMYQKIGPQLDRGVLCNGIVGVVDAPYLVLEPTHNKQDFADAKEYRHLQQAMGEHMLQYWRDIDIAQQGVSKFWENFGYISPNWHALPSSDPKYVRKRTAEVQITLQCDLCLKWRIIPYSSNNINKVFPDDWVCSMNPDPSHNRCSAAEEKPNLPEGYLKKVAKSKEQKERDLEEEIRKKQYQLEKMQKHTTPAWKRADSLSSSSSSLEDMSEVDVKKHVKKRSISNHSSGSESSQLKASKHTLQRGNHQQAMHPSPSLAGRPGPKNFTASLSTSSNTASKTISQAPSYRQPQAIKQTTSSFSSPNKRSSEPAKERGRPSLSSRIKDIRIPKIKKQNGNNKNDNNHTGDDGGLFGDGRDSEDEVDDGDDYGDRISEKRRKVVTPSVTYEKRSSKPKDKPADRKTSTSISIDDEDDDECVANNVSHPSERDAVVEEADHGSGYGATVGIQMTLGKKIKALVQKVWIEGEIVEESRSRCRIRFNESFHGITDMWFEKDSHDIQLISPRISETPTRSPSRGSETFHSDGMHEINEGEIESLIDHGFQNGEELQPRPDQSAEAPTSSTATAVSINNGAAGAAAINIQAYEEIANNFRTCLRYFLPPMWHMDKETVSTLGIPELSSFSLDDFFDQYEKGLRKLVSSFQQEAQVRQAEAQQSGSKLSAVRRMIAKLLKTINEDFEIDPECDSDEVDELLALCLRQALEHARGSNDFTS